MLLCWWNSLLELQFGKAIPLCLPGWYWIGLGRIDLFGTATAWSYLVGPELCCYEGGTYVVAGFEQSVARTLGPSSCGENRVLLRCRP